MDKFPARLDGIESYLTKSKLLDFLLAFSGNYMMLSISHKHTDDTVFSLALLDTRCRKRRPTAAKWETLEAKQVLSSAIPHNFFRAFGDQLCSCFVDLLIQILLYYCMFL